MEVSPPEWNALCFLAEQWGPLDAPGPAAGSAAYIVHSLLNRGMAYVDCRGAISINRRGIAQLGIPVS